MISYVENPIGSTKKLLVLILVFINKQCCRQKINIQKSTVFLYTGNGQSEMKWKYSETKLTKNCKSYILKATEHPEKKTFKI